MLCPSATSSIRTAAHRGHGGVWAAVGYAAECTQDPRAPFFGNTRKPEEG
jgi:hypothetical protein